MADRSAVVFDSFTSALIRNKAKQLCRRSDYSKSDFEDLRQEMLTHLWTKSHLFDPSRGNIEAFVTVVINSWIAMELRSRGRLKRRSDCSVMSLDRTLIECDGDAIELASVISNADLRRRTLASPLDPIEQIDLKDAIDHALAQLTSEERDLLFYVARHSVVGAARQQGVSRRQIDNSLIQMRSRFEDAGLGLN